jgi:hypothetical protein
MPTDVPEYEAPASNDRNPFEADFTAQEVRKRLRRCGNTAPGPDGIRYSVWKKFDKGGNVLSTVFNCVKRLGAIPGSWTKSATVLIHKKGDRSDISNWRPISMSNTITKIYSSLLAERLRNWAARNQRISPSQKGFMPVDGCAEHNFILQSIVVDARRNRKQCCIAWLDLTNAFGSVPHNTIFTALRWAGLNDEAIETIRSLYDSNTTTIRSKTGPTAEIKIKAGFKQGCPLSPVIFNLTIEPILHAVSHAGNGYQLHQENIHPLAYADDLALVTRPPDDLQRLLDVTGRVADWAGLRFNASKCATLHIDGKRKEALPTVFNIQGDTPTTLSEGDFYEHLGVPTGYHVAQSAEKVLARMRESLDLVDGSLLAPWQKFDAINTFVLPCITFHLRNGVVQKKSLDDFDKKLKAAGKRWLNLPQRAGAEPLYLSYRMGGVNLLPLNLLADVSQLVHGIRLLQSTTMGKLSHTILQAVVEKRIRRAAQPSDLVDYLNGRMDARFAKKSTDATNVWTRLRSATRRIQKKISVEWALGTDLQPQLQLRGVSLRASDVEYSLRQAVREYFRRQLLNKPDQGKVYEVTSATAPPNHFLRNGDFTSFAVWRFIHPARLDCVPLNGTRCSGGGGKGCRRCEDDNETLVNVLNHCKTHLVAVTRRHNGVLDRLVKAIVPRKGTTVQVNQTIPGLHDELRPDLLIVNGVEKSAAIIDVAMPFENRFAAFEAARNETKAKYDHIADHYRCQGYDVIVDAFIVGALGGWDPANEHIINFLKLGRQYCRLMRRLMCTDAIRWSRDVYVEHLTGQRQYEEQ